jgi:FAD/FMN-containing dehydrogenase
VLTRTGSQKWENVHVTFKTEVDSIISADNSRPPGTARPTGFDDLRESAHELDALVQEARQANKRIRALGSGWALTDIAITDGWLVNTKALNACFDVTGPYFDASYDAAKRPNLIVAQCGMSMGELNIYLEIGEHSNKRRALKTAGIGAGQTVAGAFSGNTHGAAVKFGATPDFVVGIQLVTGTGKPLWLERASYPVMNETFVANIGAELLRDDDVFNAALVSFGAFGIITAVAIETDPIYHLDFAPVQEVPHATINQHMFDASTLAKDDPNGPYHLEFVFNPYDKDKTALLATANKVDFDGDRPAPELPVWIVRNQAGYSLGDRSLRMALDIPLVPAKWKTSIQYSLYRKRAILGDLRATPGQVFTATISYFEGFTESALAISIDDVPKMFEIATRVVKRLGIAAISQVRVVHPTEALLGFTHLGPKSVVFEFGLGTGRGFPRFEKALTDALKAENVRYAFHWSKNSGLTPDDVVHMYGQDRLDRWLAARDRVFNHDASLMKVFDNAHLLRTGLA